VSDIETVTEAPAATAKPAKAAKAKPIPAPAKADPIDKALKALADGRSFSKSNIEAMIDSLAAMSRGACALREQAIAFSKQSLEVQAETAKDLAGSKTVEEFFERQQAAAKGAFEAYKAELAKLSETVSASAKAAAKPLNARASEVMAKITPAKAA
jgi:phasin family protein